MTVSNLPQGFSFALAGAKVDAPAAAREFEALLIAGLLKTAHQAGEALAAAPTQAGAEGYVELAEEHVARVMAERGALGISQILLKKLESGAPATGPGSAAPNIIASTASGAAAASARIRATEDSQPPR